MISAPINPTNLRKKLFAVLDKVIATGEPVEIKRNGHILKIILDEPVNRLDRIVPIEGLISGDPEAVLESESEWTEENNL